MSVSRSSVRQSVSQSASQSMIFHLRKIGTEKHIWTSGFYEYEHIYTYQRQEFQIIFQKKIMLFLWTVVTYLLKEC